MREPLNLSTPQTWQTATFGELFEFAYGKGLSRKERADGGEIPVYGSNGITGFHNAALVEAPCIIVGRKGAAGKVSLSEKPCWPIDTTYFIMPPVGIDLKFCYYQFANAKLEKLEKSTAIPSLSRDDAYNQTFPLPPLNEQKRIVEKIEELFSELDAGEANLRLAKEQLAAYRQSLLKHAFEGKLTEAWRKANPDKLEDPETLLKRIQTERENRYKQQLADWKQAVKTWEANGKEGKRPPKPTRVKASDDFIPAYKQTKIDRWHYLNLSSVIVELGQGWSPKCKNHPAPAGRWGVMKTTAIQDNSFEPTANKELPSSLSPRPWLALRRGDLLITRAGPRARCGVVCRVPTDAPWLMLCDKAYRFSVPENLVSSEYLVLFLTSPSASQAIDALKTGINDSGVNITQSAFLKLGVPIPEILEQNEIVKALDEHFQIVHEIEGDLEIHLAKSAALRQSILRQAFEGNLVPQDPNDEPASELLARIQASRVKGDGKKRKARQQQKKKSTK